MKERKVLVSGCLAGVLCKYNGTYNNVPEIVSLVEEGLAITVCPEILGGGSVPREPNETLGGDGHRVLDGKARVMTPSGADCTEMFIRGAVETLKIAEEHNIKIAILKERSPSCGSSLVYDGTFSGRKIAGSGVTAAILQRAGIKVYSEYNFREAIDTTGLKK